ncbi:MAG: 3-oxoacyl-ACP reductase FabG [Syntrophothermus sp.]|uniref:SDR family NAD(P)-dependent oxidoreductase n=1 Tax=Syntrophothermus sp. TaxID=2736299 RepID=UPI00257A6924|nr:3-oxoacyl-ACP reductase family protein [Syntrophothermus sp.]NSW84333.1 3-oxoacyl-ACP reductase FabG [Syntrophothermus sp.]
MLSGKVAIVTGAGRGIGKEAALNLAKSGACLIINDIDTEAANETSRELAGLGCKVVVWSGDVSVSDTTQRLREIIDRDFGRVDILINNAGGGRGLTTGFLEMSEEEWDTQIRVNLKSVFLCCKAVIGYMVRQKCGRIINISSTAALRGGGLRGTSGYATAKAGVIGLTKALAREFAKYNITAVALAPGYHQTPMHHDLGPTDYQRIIESIPLKRPGNPTDLGKIIAFLASDAASYINGTVITIDGGFTMN